MSTVLAPAPSYAPPRVRPATAPGRPGPRPARPSHRPTPRQPPTARPNLRVVQPGERTLRRLTPLAGAVLTALVFVVLAALAGAHTLIAQGQIHLDELDAKVEAEQARYQELRKDVAQAESPERIVAAAEADGMVTPTDLEYLQPPTDDGIRTDGAPADGSVARGSDPWSTIKPLLEVPTP